MEEKAKEQFKLKFYALTILLNVIILVAAGIVIALFLAPVPFKYYLPPALLVIDLVMIYVFVRNYRGTKQWLTEHQEPKKDPETEKKEP
jgi:cell division protein FtsW (lipid II flippase)